MTGKINGKQHMLKRLSAECDMKLVIDDFFGNTSPKKHKSEVISSNKVVEESCSNPKTFQNITRSATVDDVHLFVHEDHSSMEDGSDNDILVSSKTPFLSESETANTKDTQEFINDTLSYYNCSILLVV